MKKILSIIFAVLILLSCFSFCTVASATAFVPDGDFPFEMEYADIDPDTVITFSEDFKLLFVDDTAYSRYSATDLFLYTDYEVTNQILLSNTQKKEIDDILLTASKKGEMFSAEIYYKDGSELSVTYLRDDHILEYERLMKEGSNHYTISFIEGVENREDIIVDTKKSLLMTEKTNLKVNEVFLIDFFSVYIRSQKLGFLIETGYLLEYKDDYYYVDFAENRTNSEDISVWDFEGTAHKILDPDLISEIESASLLYYADSDYGFFFDDEFSKSISNIFLVLTFGIIPFALFIASIILGFKLKGLYKKLFFTISGLSAAVMVTFIIVMAI